MRKKARSGELQMQDGKGKAEGVGGAASRDLKSGVKVESEALRVLFVDVHAMRAAPEGLIGSGLIKYKR